MTVSFLLMLSFILRQIFNFFQDPEENLLAVDKYLTLDFTFSTVNYLVFQYIVVLPVSYILDNEKKDTLDIMVVTVLMLNWSRFFVLFLVIPSVSKMLLTLISMLVDVGPFTLIMICYMIFASQVFQTQY